jgi:hypothetical protein
LEVKEQKRFEQRVSQLKNPATRKVIWVETIDLVKEKPLFGFGYESFKQQNSILKKVKKEFDTPHNLYLQLLVSGGIVGLLLWGVLILSTLFLLIVDLIKNKTYFNIAVILSSIAFHLYGLAQTMQYIPMIWLLIFMNIGYAMTINEQVLPDWVRKVKVVSLMGLFLMVMAGVAAYAFDFESKSLAVKKNWNIYALDQNQNKYLGFYRAEQWGKQGIYRWTGSSAAIKLPRAERFKLTFICSAPDLADNPLVLSVFDGDTQIDEISFIRQQSVSREYFIPQARFEEKKLNFHVSRTWNLWKLGVSNDRRNLGGAISEIKVIVK